MHFFSVKATFLQLKCVWNVCYRPRPTQTLSGGGCLCEKKFTFSFWQVCVFDISAHINRRKICVSVEMSHDALLLRHMMLDPGLNEELHTKLMSLRTSGYVAPQPISSIMGLPEANRATNRRLSCSSAPLQNRLVPPFPRCFCICLFGGFMYYFILGFCNELSSSRFPCCFLQ